MTSRHGSASADGRTKSAKSKAKDDDALMDFAPGKVLGVEELSSVKGSVTAKLSELMGESCDEVFPEYITVMVSNGKTIREISTQLEDLLTAGTATVFSKWLGNHLRGLGDKGSAPVSTASSAPAASEPLSSSSKKAKATSKGRDSGQVGRGANGVSSRGVGGGGGPASDGAGVTGRVGGTGGRSKTSGSKVSNTASGGARDAGLREWSKSRSRDGGDSWGSSQDRSRGSSRDRSRDAPRNRSRRSRDSPRDWSRDRPRGRGRERPKERSRDRSVDRSRERSKDRSKDRSKGNVRDGKNRPRAKSGDSRDRSRDYGSFATSKDRSRDTNVAPRDRHRNGTSSGGGGVGSGGRVNDSRDRTKDHARDNYSRGEERDDGRRESRHGGAANAPAPAPRTRGDQDNNGRRAKERSVERSAERVAERSARLRGGQRDDDGGEEEGKRESSDATKRSAGERIRHKQGERRRDAEAKGGKEGKEGKVRSKKKSTAGEREDRRDSRGGREERAADASSAVVGTPPAKIEEPMVVSVLGSVAVIGDSVRKEELDAANERAKLPDLRTVIERSRRRPNPARKEDEKKHGDYEKEHGDYEKEHGDGVEHEDDGKEHEDNRKGPKGEDRPVVARGRMAGAKGGMRGFSPEAPSNGKEAGVKRELSEETPPHQLRQRAFVASGGGRLLSNAVKQSVQSAKAPGLDASGGYSGEKRRKSGGTDGRSDGDSNRYVITSGNGVDGDTVEFNEVPEEAAQAPLEERKDVMTILRTPGKLRVSAREFQPTSDGVSRAVPPVTPSTLVSGPSALASYEQGGPDTFDSTWQHIRTGEGEDEMHDQDFAAADYEGSAVGGGHSSNVWSRLGPRANVNGSGSGAGNYNARHATSAAALSFPADARDFLDAQRLAGGARGTQSWAEWAQSIGSVPGSPSDAAAKWAAALRVAAGAATAAAASSSNSAVNAGMAGGGRGMPLARGGSEDLAYIASYSAAAQAEEGLPFGVAGMGWEESVGGSSGSRGGGRGSRGGPGGRFGRGRTGGRNFTWVREGLRGRGRGRGVPGGRGFRGAGTWRGRGVATKNLGKGGGWHSTGSAAGRGTGTAAMAEAGRGVGGSDPAVGQRETWHKVWVRKDLQDKTEGSAGVGAAQQHGEDNP